MCYKYGVNGNDLDFDFLTFGVNEVCVDCEEAYKETGEWPEYCEGHTTKFSDRGWAVYLDNNHNSVSTAGKVPLAVYGKEYLVEWFDYLGKWGNSKADYSQRARLKKELKARRAAN